MDLINVLVIILILSATSLCVFSIIYLKRILEQMKAVRNDICRLAENTIPVLRNMDEITRRVNRIAADIEGYWIEIDYSINNLREKIWNLGPRGIIFGSQTQVPGLLKNIGAITKGVSAFWRNYKQG